ncbi:hypothetical protein J8J27_29335, partial [Mycobacterium tuberculosis]|nr:hypothetical protein [Mycobacterium tuberculosis]
MFDRFRMRCLAVAGLVLAAGVLSARADEATLKQALTLADKGDMASIAPLRGRMTQLENKLTDWT